MDARPIKLEAVTAIVTQLSEQLAEVRSQMSACLAEIFGCGSRPIGSDFGVGAPPDWDFHWGVTGLLTHGHLPFRTRRFSSPDARLTLKSVQSMLGMPTARLGQCIGCHRHRADRQVYGCDLTSRTSFLVCDLMW